MEGKEGEEERSGFSINSMEEKGLTMEGTTQRESMEEKACDVPG